MPACVRRLGWNVNPNRKVVMGAMTKSRVNGNNSCKICLSAPVLAFLALFIILPTLSLAEGVADTLKTIFASQAMGEIKADGFLNEPDWAEASAQESFTQTEPEDGVTPDERTQVMILYDDEAVYVGFKCYDHEPDKIEAVLSRRDRWTESDQVAVRIDSHHDHQTAYYFSVNAAGCMRDLLIYNNDWADESWDAVWEADAKLTDWGWSAEFKIPYSALRFSRADDCTWGVQFNRYVPRTRERMSWQYVPESETGGVSRYGHLAGVSGIEPPGRLETLPYIVSSGTSEPKSAGNPDGRKTMSDIGLDFKYGISSAFTLDAAVNPDFGQVESDQSVMNLSAYETFFEEKRPFFLEGFEIFQSNYFNQYYSRRIGRPPQGSIDSADYYIDYPNATSILEALKISGKTPGGTAFALLNATTKEEKTRYRLAGDESTYKGVVEPLANYTIARVKQDLFKSSYVGGLFTSANQNDRTDAYTASSDWSLKFSDDTYCFDGQAIMTNNGPGTNGYAISSSIGKESGRNFRFNINADYYDRQVNWNRLGYMGDNSSKGIAGWFQLRSNKKFSLFRYLNINVNSWYNENLDGYRLSNGGNINGTIIFKNYWAIWWGISHSGDKYDVRETRGMGLFKRTNGPEFWCGWDTNGSRKLYFSNEFCIGETRNGDYYNLDYYLTYRMLSNVELTLETDYEKYRDMEYWVGSANGLTNGDTAAAFGLLDKESLDITLRGIYTFTRNLTLQCYTQLYFSAGNYDHYTRLEGVDRLVEIDPGVYELSLSRGDYNYKSLNLNLILRWEYRPGSTIYVVWTEARDGSDGLRDGYDCAFEFSRDFGDLMDLPRTDTFLIKANYWWNI